jgi:integrase/recombinase XerD
MTSVSTVLRTDKKNKVGESPIHFRIIKDRKISYISSGIMILVELWDVEKNKVKSKHPNSKRFNAFLANKFAELQDNVFANETESKSLTSRQLRNKIYGNKPTEFIPFAEKALKVYLSEGKIGTHDKNKSILAKFQDYIKNPTICFQDITAEFLTNYENFLRTTHKNSINTIHKDLKFIRKLFNDAYAQELIEHNIIPFNRYKLKTEKTQRIYLSEEELKVIEKLKYTAGTRIDLHRDMFVFASYAGGLRVSDMLKIQWKHFDGTNINFTIKKTGTQLSIKVPNKGLEILDKYKLPKTDKNAYIFPMLPKDLNLDNPVDVDIAISSATSYINKNLKSIATKAKIEKHLSFHISRHTWATRALKKGISIDKVSKLMGHAAIKETQIYAKIVSSELDKAMDVFND